MFIAVVLLLVERRLDCLALFLCRTSPIRVDRYSRWTVVAWAPMQHAMESVLHNRACEEALAAKVVLDLVYF